uniref:Uncharacterized protein n=1 Tax=Vitis vinifera TaxID=29760 RepID=F6HRF6_VITVI
MTSSLNIESVDLRLLGVSKLSVVKGWMGKSNDETNKHMHTCLT